MPSSMLNDSKVQRSARVIQAATSGLSSCGGVPLRISAVERYASGVEHRAHRAVTDQHATAELRVQPPALVALWSLVHLGPSLVGEATSPLASDRLRDAR